MAAMKHATLDLPRPTKGAVALAAVLWVLVLSNASCRQARPEEAEAWRRDLRAALAEDEEMRGFFESRKIDVSKVSPDEIVSLMVSSSRDIENSDAHPARKAVRALGKEAIPHLARYIKELDSTDLAFGSVFIALAETRSEQAMEAMLEIMRRPRPDDAKPKAPYYFRPSRAASTAIFASADLALALGVPPPLDDYREFLIDPATSHDVTLAVSAAANISLWEPREGFEALLKLLETDIKDDLTGSPRWHSAFHSLSGCARSHIGEESILIRDPSTIDQDAAIAHWREWWHEHKEAVIADGGAQARQRRSDW